MEEDIQECVKDGKHDETKHHVDLYPTKSISRAWEALDFKESQSANMTQAQREIQQGRDGIVFAMPDDHERVRMDHNSMQDSGATHLDGHLIARAEQPEVDSRRKRGLVLTQNIRDQMTRSYMTTTEILSLIHI